MPEYEVRVIETVEVDRVYKVEADSPEAAMEMAERGETIEEQTVKTRGVTGRYVEEDDVTLVSGAPAP